MDKNAFITIESVNNGFLVSDKPPENNMCTFEDKEVFQSMEELIEFIRSHFNYRNAELKSDEHNTPET